MDHLLGHGLAEGTVHALQDLASVPVHTSIGPGVIGPAPGGIDHVVPLHGANGPGPGTPVKPDVIVDIHNSGEDNCTQMPLPQTTDCRVQGLNRGDCTEGLGDVCAGRDGNLPC